MAKLLRCRKPAPPPRKLWFQSTAPVAPHLCEQTRDEEIDHASERERL
jgi:hypothetical protein